MYLQELTGLRANGIALQLAVRRQCVDVCKYLLENDSFTCVELERGVLLAERLGDALDRAELLGMLGDCLKLLKE
jgi:hypothetical protein